MFHKTQIGAEQAANAMFRVLKKADKRSLDDLLAEIERRKKKRKNFWRLIFTALALVVFLILLCAQSLDDTETKNVKCPSPICYDCPVVAGCERGENGVEIVEPPKEWFE